MKSKAVIFFLIVCSLLSAQRNYSFGWHTESIKVLDQTRHFKFYIPKGLDKNAPAVFLFHSENKSMNNIFGTEAGGFREWPNLADREKFILIIPNGTNPVTGDFDGNNQLWNDCRKESQDLSQFSRANDIDFITKLIDWSKNNLPIDKTRIYASGVSNGGMMVYRLAIELGDKIAGAAVFLANMSADSECSKPKTPLPILIMNGTDDPIIPFEGGVITGNRGMVLSAEETLNIWVKLNYLNTQKRTNKYLTDLNPDDGSRIIKNEFNRPLGNPPVAFYVVVDGGHTIPSIKYPLPKSLTENLLGNQNRDIEGVVEAWKFLRKFSK
ncbi:MAG: hypothetical protein U5K00_15460 [Melioribacteraceae bacterium]|nr:hypothetical protein [Melioribacteraceae bacterium]